MIPGDEGKPMSILERISDEPCEPEPYIDYLMRWYEGLAEQTWEKLPDSDEAKASVLLFLRGFVTNLDEIKRKMHRPSRPDTGKAKP